MKIAIVERKFTPCGGGEKYGWELAHWLLKKGYEVHIITQEKEGETSPKFHFHFVKKRGKGMGLEKYFFSRGVKRILAREKFNLVYSSQRTGAGEVIRAGGGSHRRYLQAELKACRNFWERVKKKITQILSLSNFLTLWYEKKEFLSGNYKKILVNSKMVKEEIIKDYSLPEEDLEVIYNGVDAQRFSPQNRKSYRETIRQKYGIDPEEKVIVFVGTGFERKGLIFLFSALRELPQVKLLVVGRGKIKKYKKIARRWRIEKRVRFTGKVKDPEKYYAAADVFVLPTLYDPFANTTLEAMASGLPIITTRSNGAKEVIEEGKEGFVVDTPPLPNELAKRIKLAFQEKERMGKEAQTRAQHFTLQKNLELTFRVLEELMRR